MSALNSATQAPHKGDFTHAPRPPIVPTEAKYSQQRRYGVPTEAYGMHLKHDIKEPTRNVLTVFRDGHHDVAELTIDMGVMTLARITVRMTPAELRRAAASMLDAAHDIEMFPAELLQRDAQQGGAA